MAKRPRTRDLQPSPVRDYEKLMQDICVGLGFCGGWVNGQASHVDNFIPASGPVTAAQFAKWVIEAEGMDSECSTYQHALESAFVRHMGSTIVDAGALRWTL